MQQNPNFYSKIRKNNKIMANFQIFEKKVKKIEKLKEKKSSP